jgi:hypothetical protein
MFRSHRLLSAFLFVSFAFAETISHAAGPKPIICYAFAFRKGGATPEARTQAFGVKGNEAFAKRRALENCYRQYPESNHYRCVPAGCRNR